MTDHVLPLGPGDSGDAVRDLHRRLGAAGFPVGDRSDVYGPATAEAVTRFQESRGLERDGVCGPQTWNALIEAAFRLGDRLLYLRSPMYRGDDVAELQRRLGALGFNAGRVDGVFGPDTAEAVADFQRNVSVTTDAVVGPETIAVLERVSGRASGRSVATVLEAEALRARPPALRGGRIVLGDFGGAAALTAATARLLGRAGAVVTTVSDEDALAHATFANDFDAIAYVGFVVTDEAVCRAVYFSTSGFESPGGHRLADLICERCGPTLGAPGESAGMRLPVLRATRMPAVTCRFGPPTAIVRSLGHLAEQLTDAVRAWALAPVDGEGSPAP